MTPDEHMAAAEELAAAAADLIRSNADEALPERMQAAETSRAMAAIGRLHVDLSVVRTARPDPGDWELLATGPALAPVADVTPMRRAPADAPAEAPNQHPRKD